MKTCSRNTKINNLLKILLIICFTGSPTFATDTTDRKRSLDSDWCDQIEKKPRQVFARPTYDTVAKHVFQDDQARLEFIKTFTGLSIESTELLDPSLNPANQHLELRNVINNQSVVEAMNDIESTDTLVVKKNGKATTALGKFVKGISRYYEDLRKLMPNQDYNAQADVVCQMSNRDYAMVEIQVAKQDHWDARALYYAASLYGNQLKSGSKWHDLKKVIVINILGAGPQNVKTWKDSTKPNRHYKFVDTVDEDTKHIIPHIQLIQYSLGNTDLTSQELAGNKPLRDWLDYFKNAHGKQQIPDNITPGLKAAYEKSMIESMPEDIKMRYDAEDKIFHNYSQLTADLQTESFQKGIEQGIEQGRGEGFEQGQKAMALNLIKSNLLSLDQIASITGLDVKVLEDLKYSLAI